MKCENCGTEMYITSTEYQATGDNSPDTKTKIFTIPYFICHNERCPLQGRKVKGEAIELTSTPLRLKPQKNSIDEHHRAAVAAPPPSAAKIKN